MAVVAHHDVPAVVVDLGVAALAEQAAVVEVGGSAVGPVFDVVHLLHADGSVEIEPVAARGRVG